MSASHPRLYAEASMSFMPSGEQVVRPPLQAKSLLLRVMYGCTYNKCLFCKNYRETPLTFLDLEHIERELVGQLSNYPEDTPIYLVGANPLALPFERLKSILLLIKKHVPRHGAIAFFARVTDVEAKTAEQLAALKELGLTLLYLGIESGYDKALALHNKGVTARQSLEQMRRLDEAGIAYEGSFMTGLAGHGDGEQNAIKTAELFNQAHPVAISTTGLTLFSDSPIHSMGADGRFQESGEKEKLEELLIFLKHLNVKTRFDARHVLNSVFFVAQFPEEKNAIIARLAAYLDTHSAEDIEAGYQRHARARN